MNSLHVLVVDDHALFRKGVISAIQTVRPKWKFSEAKSGRDAIVLLQSYASINIVLLDISMPEMNGVEFCNNLKRSQSNLPIIVLTQYDEHSLIRHLLSLGINGYLLKNTDPEVVVEAVETVVTCGRYINELLLKALETSIGAKLPPAQFNLSQRDHEIIQLVCRGKSTKEIASELHLPETSIESYRKDLLHRTCTHNVAEFVSFVHRTGIVTALTPEMGSKNHLLP
jgi:DNA-binding NarL/FixJ family response regulator